MTTPGQQWRQSRDEAGLSAQAAADLAGVHRNTIYDIEKDEDGVTLRVMKKVADVYGKSLGEIFRDDRTPERVPAEFQPLLEPLRLLTFPQRVSLIRNVASNLSYMATVYGSVTNDTLRSVENGSAVTKPVNNGLTRTILTGGLDHAPSDADNDSSGPSGDSLGSGQSRKGRR